MTPEYYVNIELYFQVNLLGNGVGRKRPIAANRGPADDVTVRYASIRTVSNRSNT